MSRKLFIPGVEIKPRIKPSTKSGVYGSWLFRRGPRIRGVNVHTITEFPPSGYILANLVSGDSSNPTPDRDKAAAELLERSAVKDGDLVGIANGTRWIGIGQIKAGKITWRE